MATRFKRIDNPVPQSAIVVGGGVVGRSVALALQQGGLATTLIDPEPEPRQASWGNAGHVAVEQVEPLASRATVQSMPRRLFWRGGALSLPWRDIDAWLPFSCRLLLAARPARFAAGEAALTAALATAMPAWQRLLTSAGARELLREDGHFVIWESAETAAKGRARWASSPLGTTAIRDVTPEEMARLQSLTSAPIAGAIRFIGSGQIADLGELATALATAFESAGGVRKAARVERFTIADGQAVPVLDNGTRLAADAIVVAAGARSSALMRPLGHVVPLIAERGYHIQSAQTGWDEHQPPVVFEDRSMIVTRFRSGLRAASFVEFSRMEARPDPRKWQRLRRHVAALGLSFEMPGAEWIGARPTLPDYLPALGRSNAADNLFYAFGHQHLGLTLAAATGEVMAALVTGAQTPFDLAPFDLDRFR